MKVGFPRGKRSGFAEGGVAVLAVFAGMVVLAWPLGTIPALLENKRKTGSYFSKDPRILVAKSTNMGNNLNMQNKWAFWTELVLGLILIGFGIVSLIN